MLCNKCGSKINDDAKFCSNCGAAVTQPSIPVGVKAGIMAAVVLAFAIVAVGVIGTFSWYNRPINRIDRAIRSDDVETVAELYGKLKRESDEARVQQEMLSMAEELKDSYIYGEKNYDEVMDTYGLLDKEILAGDRSFREIKKKVEAVEDSREAYKEADKLFDEGDYIGAKEKYILVIEDDLNYADARRAIEECEKKITGAIVSTWSVEYDMSELMNYNSYFYDYIYLPAKIVFDFKENGTGSMSVQITDTTVWAAELTDFYVMYFEAYYDISGEELEEFMQYMGYESLDEWVNEELEEEIDYINDESYTFEYLYDGSTLSIWDDDENDSEEIMVSIEGDDLTFVTSSNESDWEEMGLDLPLVFTRDNADL